MDDFILTYQNGVTTILSNNVFFNSDVKPTLSFSFDTLICESPTNVYFRMLGDNQFLLTEEEILECKDMCSQYYLTGNYNVYAYDPNDNNLYKGYIKKSECEEKNYKYVVDKAPDGLTASYNEETSSWIVYYAAITDEGNLIENVQLLNCPKCVLFLTKEQFDVFPKKNKTTDSWDFTTESWVDKRDLAKLKKESSLNCRNQFEAIRWKANEKFIPQFEQDTWIHQVEEARKYTEAKNYALNNSVESINVDTPYIDTFLQYREDDNIPTKDELVADILDNHTKYLQAMAKVNAKQWYYLKKIEKASTGYEIDDVNTEIKNYINEII